MLDAVVLAHLLGGDLFLALVAQVSDIVSKVESTVLVAVAPVRLFMIVFDLLMVAMIVCCQSIDVMFVLGAVLEVNLFLERVLEILLELLVLIHVAVMRL